MLRLLRTRKWVGLTVLALVLIVAFGALGLWQWTRAQDVLDAERAALEVPMPVVEIAPVGDRLPADAVGRRATATGAYGPGALYVSDRALDGTRGFWVLSPLDLGDGTVVAVLRGWVPTQEALATGEVAVSGVLQAMETFYKGSTAKGDVIVAMTHDELTAAWGPQVRSGILFLTGQTPAFPGDPALVAPTVRTDVAFPLQNFFYALEWVVFSGFVVFVWWRWLRIDARKPEEAQ